MSTKELREKLGIRSVDKNLITLRKHGEIKWVWKVVNVKSKTDGQTIAKPVMYYYV